MTKNKLNDLGGETDVIGHDGNQSMLVRTWAAAARVAMTKSTDALIEKANLISQFPALGRRIGFDRTAFELEHDSNLSWSTGRSSLFRERRCFPLAGDPSMAGSSAQTTCIKQP